jgi:hypothetical protein
MESTADTLEHLGDFTTTTRVVPMALLAIVIGFAAAYVAWALPVVDRKTNALVGMLSLTDLLTRERGFWMRNSGVNACSAPGRDGQSGHRRHEPAVRIWYRLVRALDQRRVSHVTDA